MPVPVLPLSWMCPSIQPCVLQQGLHPLSRPPMPHPPALLRLRSHPLQMPPAERCRTTSLPQLQTQGKRNKFSFAFFAYHTSRFYIVLLFYYPFSDIKKTGYEISKWWSIFNKKTDMTYSKQPHFGFKSNYSNLMLQTIRKNFLRSITCNFRYSSHPK